MSRLLFDKHPLVVIPELAKIIGLNGAIILQQIHYWVNHNRKASKNYEDGEFWTYNSYEEWQRQFPFWSISTIRRSMRKLQIDGFLVVGNYNKFAADNTNWYRVNYNKLNDLEKSSEQTTCSKWTGGISNKDRPIPEIYSETKNKDIFLETPNFLNIDKKSTQPLHQKSEEQFQAVFDIWSDAGVRKGEKLTDGLKKTIANALKPYTQEEIIQSIKNYAQIMSDPKYWFEFRWTLESFLNLQRHDNVAKFINLKEAQDNYLRKETNFKKAPSKSDDDWPRR